MKAHTHTHTHTHTTNLLHHLILFMEELHFDVSTNWQRLGEFKKHVLVLAPRVSGIRRVNLDFQLVHHKLGICKEWRRCTGTGERDYENCERKKTENTRRRVSDRGVNRESKTGLPVLLHEFDKNSTAHHHHTPPPPPTNEFKTAIKI